MFSFRIEGFEVDRSGKPAPLCLKECINIYIYNVVHALMIYEHIVLPGFPMF